MSWVCLPLKEERAVVDLCLGVIVSGIITFNVSRDVYCEGGAGVLLIIIINNFHDEQEALEVKFAGAYHAANLLGALINTRE